MAASSGEWGRMKAARIIVLTVAVAAGGVAATLAGRSDKPSEVRSEAPKFDTVEVLIAKSDIARGQTLSSADLSWQAWPAATTGTNFIRKPDQPNALEKLSGLIVRAPFVAGEPIREIKLVDVKGAGFLAAVLSDVVRGISSYIASS